MAFSIGKDFEKNLGKDISTLEIKEPEEKQQSVTETEKKETVDKPIPPPEKTVDETKDSMGFTKVDTKELPDPDKQTTTDTVTEEAVLEFIKSKGKEVKSIDELLGVQEKEVVKEVNPYEDIFDDEDKAYFKYKKETGRSRKDWEALNKDITGMAAIDIARDRIRMETGMDLTNAEADEYLASTLSIDLEDELDTVAKIKLNGYAKPHRDKLIEEQAKYKKPLEKAQANTSSTTDNIVRLEDGTSMTKEVYEQKIKEREGYVRDMTEAVNSVTALDFKVTVDDNGEKSELNISYELSKDDKHSMLSDVLDVDAMVQRDFRTENGFNHSEFRDTIFRGKKKNFVNIMNAVAQRVRAATIQEMISNSNNINFKHQPIQRQTTPEDGYGSITGTTGKSGFGVKYSGFEKV